MLWGDCPREAEQRRLVEVGAGEQVLGAAQVELERACGDQHGLRYKRLQPPLHAVAASITHGPGHPRPGGAPAASSAAFLMVTTM